MKKPDIRKWAAKGINRLGKVLSGDVVLKLGLDKSLGLVCYIFLLISALIAWSLTVENDMVKIKNNERKLEELRIHYHQTELNYIGMDSRSTVNRMLESYSSKLKAPACPPKRVVIKKEEE